MFFVKLKSFIRDYLTLTSRERKGALVLAAIIGFQILGIIWLNYLSPPFEPVIKAYRLQLDAFDKKTAAAGSQAAGNFHNNRFASPVTSATHILKPFDPNTITDDEWMKLGLSQKQTKVIRNYLNKGGRFRNKESLSKMYCISPELYQQLEPWVLIPEKEKTTNTPTKNFSNTSKKILKVDLNTADTILLTELPLIGPGRARMIYKYRERLGGFVSINQLLEVFTIDSVTIEAIRPYIHLNPEKIRKLHINSDSLYHPYLGKRTATAIIAYRKQHGNFVDINGLRKVALLDEQIWLKVAPYAVFE